MNYKDNRAETEASVETGTCGPVLRLEEGGVEGEGRAAQRDASCLQKSALGRFCARRVRDYTSIQYIVHKFGSHIKP